MEEESYDAWLYKDMISMPWNELEVLLLGPQEDGPKKIIQERDWWCERIEHLTGIEIPRMWVPHIDQWKRASLSLEKNGTDFNPKQDYGSLLLVHILLYSGADPILCPNIMNLVIEQGSLDVLRTLLKNKELDLTGCLENATRLGHTDAVNLLLGDQRLIKPS